MEQDDKFLVSGCGPGTGSTRPKTWIDQENDIGLSVDYNRFLSSLERIQCSMPSV
jgi:hypothetical protein